MGMDDLQRSNEPVRPSAWHWHCRVGPGWDQACSLCPRTINAGADLWTDGEAVAHQQCAQQANRRAAASESI